MNRLFSLFRLHISLGSLQLVVRMITKLCMHGTSVLSWAGPLSSITNGWYILPCLLVMIQDGCVLCTMFLSSANWQLYLMTSHSIAHSHHPAFGQIFSWPRVHITWINGWGDESKLPIPQSLHEKRDQTSSMWPASYVVFLEGRKSGLLNQLFILFNSECSWLFRC